VAAGLHRALLRSTRLWSLPVSFPCSPPPWFPMPPGVGAEGRGKEAWSLGVYGCAGLGKEEGASPRSRTLGVDG